MSRGVVLGQGARRRRILVPPGMEDRAIIGHCTVPGCGQRFYAGQEELWQRHVGPCARANLDKIQAVMRRKGASILHEDFDPEVSAHMRQLGQRMIEEGRLEVKPHERAGFS